MAHAMSFLTFILISLSIWLATRYFRSSNRLPPGPPKLPIIGSILSLPAREQFKTFRQWSKTYNSDLLHFDILGSSYVVINSYEIAKELLDRRSRHYSDRPPFVLLTKLMRANWEIGFLPYGDKVRNARRLSDREFRASAVQAFSSTQTQYCYELLQLFLDHPTPPNVMKHIHSMTARSILTISYGLEIGWNDPISDIAEAFCTSAFEAAVMPVTVLMDAFPLLQYLPSWMPGGGFKRNKLPQWIKAAYEAYEIPFAAAKAACEAKAALPSLVSHTLNRKDYDPESMEDIVKSAAATMYTAGADTTSSTLGTFILNMLAHPSIQRKAHEELDTKLERRLPTLDDQASLPFITAILKECLRWMVVGPLALPHYTKVDDLYAGYYIPAETTVLPNIWAMAHNEENYPDSFTFNPDRFMKDGELNPDVFDPENFVFGFGRRVCPGRWVSLSSAWITIASILTVFEIRKAVDTEGNVIEPHYRYRSNLALMPEPFTCQFVPRLSNAKELLTQGTGKS